MRGKSIVILVGIIAAIAVLVSLTIRPITGAINLGLDLQGGLHVVMEAKKEPGNPITDDKMERVKAVIENRVNQTGVKEPIIQREGSKRLIVELAGVKDPDEAVKQFLKTAVLTFRDEKGNVVLRGEDVKDAREQKNPTTGEVEISLILNKEGTKKFAEATKVNLGKPIGIFLDETRLTNPVVKSVITNGRAVITGYETLEAAHKDAILIRSGALPLKMEIIEKRTVGPTLGLESLKRSEKAGVAGLLAILLFMILYYRLPGLIANFSLVVYSFLVLAILAAFGATLTLPGIAGFLLSIGMAVDANIIIFERLKEELREGKTIRSAIDAGFSRAFITIFDSNATTVIAAVVLYYFGTGAIRGFAVTLITGILVSMFTAITFTRFMLRLVANSGIRNKKLYGA